MRRLALAAAVIATILCREAATPAQAQYYAYTVGYAACEPFPDRPRSIPARLFAKIEFPSTRFPWPVT